MSDDTLPSLAVAFDPFGDPALNAVRVIELDASGGPVAIDLSEIPIAPIEGGDETPGAMDDIRDLLKKGRSAGDRWRLDIGHGGVFGEWADFGINGDGGFTMFPKGDGVQGGGGGDDIIGGPGPGDFSDTGLVSEGTNLGTTGLAIGIAAWIAWAGTHLGEGWVEVKTNGSSSNSTATATVHNGAPKKDDASVSVGAGGSIGVGISSTTGNLVLIVAYGNFEQSTTIDSGVKPNFDTWLRIGGAGKSVTIKTPNPMDDGPYRGPMPSWGRRRLRDLNLRSPKSDSSSWADNDSRGGGRPTNLDLGMLVGGGVMDPVPYSDAGRGGAAPAVGAPIGWGRSDPGGFGSEG